MPSFLSFFLLILALASCSPTLDGRGYNPETLSKCDIQPGVDTNETVLQKLGTPSTVSAFPDEKNKLRWYYIFKKTSTTSFFKPETLEQQTLIVVFDANQRVIGVEKQSGEKEIAPSEKITETTGYESSAMRDVFGNFGRYSGKTPTNQPR